MLVAPERVRLARGAGPGVVELAAVLGERFRLARAPPVPAAAVTLGGADGRGLGKAGDLQLISVHNLVHELLPTDASHAQWITCATYCCPPNLACTR